MPAAPSSLTDPAIGQLLVAARALGGERAGLLPVLAAVPDPRARRGVRLRLAVILGLDDTAGAWAQQRTEPSPGARRVVAVDGKALRGSGVAGGPGRHLLAALDHAYGVVLGPG